MSTISPLQLSTLEILANTIADIDPNITGAVIHRILLQSQIDDVSYSEQFLAKRKKLFNAFEKYQNDYNCANNIVLFIQNVLSPQRYVKTIKTCIISLKVK